MIKLTVIYSYPINHYGRTVTAIRRIQAPSESRDDIEKVLDKEGIDFGQVWTILLGWPRQAGDFDGQEKFPEEVEPPQGEIHVGTRFPGLDTDEDP